jgi:Nucleotidyltransferase
VPAKLEVQEHNLRDRLIRADFKERFLGDDQPPATHYELGEEGGAFYAEFLTPLIGSEYDRDGKRRATTRVAGVTSQNLRHVDLLLDSPWTVDLSRGNGFAFEATRRVRIAHPTRFMAQKLLIHEKRERRSRAKDILYLHDTIELLGAALDLLGEEWKLAKQGLAESSVRTVEGAVDTMFSKVTDDIRSAAQAAAGRAMSPQAVQELCREGLKIVFAGESAHARK